MDLDMQRELFEIALDAIGMDGDLINQVIEVTLEDINKAVITVIRYALPDR